MEKDRWEMATGYIDTCYYFDSSNYRTRLMAASLHLNDTIDPGRIAAGIYILKFTRDQSVVTRKIIRVFPPLPAY